MVTPKQFAVIDFETTGFGHTDRVIEVGVVLLNHNHEVERTWETLIQPNRDISNSFVHHITAGDVADAPTFEQVSGELAGLLNGRTVVAHNAPFEVRFLRREFGRVGLLWPTYGAWIVDTMRLVKQRFPGEPSTLTHALDLLGITNTRPHSALADAQATADLFTRLTEDGSELLMSSATLALPPFTYPPARGILARNSSAAPQVSRNQWLASLSAGIPNKGTGDVEQYKKILTAALADRELSRTEIRQLEQQAERDGLGRDDLLSIHEEFIRQLAIEAWLDGVITEEERATVTTLNEQLGLPAELADELLAEPQEGESQLGLSLNVGDRVTFTGQLDLPRDVWEKRAEAVGLNVGGVTKKSALLIAADPDSMSGKVKKAREYGVPVVGEKTFAQLVHNMTGDVVSVEEDLSHAEPSVEYADFAEVFPWSSRNTATDKAQSSRELALAWCTKYPYRPLEEMSPYLTATTRIEIHSSFRGGYTQWFARYSEPLTAAVEDLRDLRGVGEHKLLTMVEAVVLAAIDAHAATMPAEVGPLDGFYDDEHHDSDFEEFTGATEFAGSRNAPGVNWADITLYAGWLKLTNVGADHRDIPEAVLDEMPALVGHLEAVDPVKELFDRVAQEVRAAAEGDPRKLTIVKKRLIGDATLDEIGVDFGVTRERVRQLERDWKKQFEANNPLFSAVVDAIHQRVAPIARVSVVRHDLPALVSEVEELECTYSDLFVALGKKWKVSNGWAVEPGFKKRVKHALDELSNDYGVVALAEVSEELGVSSEILEEYIVTSDKLKVVILDDKVLTMVGSHQDRAVSVLSINGEPMSAKDIMEVAGGGNYRSAANQFAVDPRMRKVNAEQWGLADWGLEEFKSIASWIGQRVQDSSQTHMVVDGEGSAEQQVRAVPLADLLAEAERLRIAESSIRLYASVGEFETRDGMVFERVDESGNVIEGDIEDTRDVYLRDGSWHLLVKVTKDHLRGSGFPVPLGVAAYYGLKVGEEVALNSPMGEQYVRVNRLKNASISTMKRFLDDMGIQEGQRVWLKLGEDKTFDVTRAENDEPGLDGVQWLYNVMGLDPKQVTVGESIEESLARVNIALGLNPMAPRRRTVATFRHRKQDDIADRVREL